MRIILSTLNDLPLLPQPWNFEFWTKVMSEEEIEMTLVNIGEIFSPTQPLTHLSVEESQIGDSVFTSKYTSRGTSVRSSKRNSFRRTNEESRSERAHINNGDDKSPHPHNLQPTTSSCRDEQCRDESESEWEWVWEDDDGNEIMIDDSKEKSLEIQEDRKLTVDSETPILTMERLEEVKEIIEKPEERWRTMWRKSLDSSGPSRTVSISSINSVFSGTSLAFTNQYPKKRENVIQAGIDKSDPLSIVKVGSAKQWKAISKNLTINFNDIELQDGDVKTNPKTANDNAEVGQNDSSLIQTQGLEERPTTPQSFVDTTVQQLRMICWKIKPWEYPKEKKLFHSLLGAGWGVDCDEVYPNLFVGDEASARNIRFLKKMGITHVLNTAEGIWTDCSFVDLATDYYIGSGIAYQGLQLWDHNCVRILPYLGCANEFIATGMNSGGRVLVNCQMGVSRSSTAAIAYMMLSNDWKVEDVLRLFRKRRDVRPNDFYLTQLVELDNDLRKLRECGVPRKIKLHNLNDIDFLPKPWHYQFWESIPTDETLPFSLSCVCEPRPDMEAVVRKPFTSPRYGNCPQGIDCKVKRFEKISTINAGEYLISNTFDMVQTKCTEDEFFKELPRSSIPQSKRQSKCSTRSSSSWEWEYYEDSDDLLDELDDSDTQRNSNETVKQNEIFPYFHDLKNED
jgi:predicted protein tyrosine phosphatase